MLHIEQFYFVHFQIQQIIRATVYYLSTLKYHNSTNAITWPSACKHHMKTDLLDQRGARRGSCRPQHDQTEAP